LFISDRDSKSYRIFYGPPPEGVASGIVAFEQEGVDGHRYIGYSLGMVEEADEARFNKLVPPNARGPK
jgi:hypothetical protein